MSVSVDTLWTLGALWPYQIDWRTPYEQYVTSMKLLAYVPAAIVELSFLQFIQNRWDLQWDLSAPASLLGFLGLSVAVGFLIDAVGHLLVREWQRRERNLVLFGQPDSRSVLFQYMELLYPNTKNADVEDKVDLVNAIFNSHVSVHVYARRNWDWTFHETSRNLLISSPLTAIGLMLSASTWSVLLVTLIPIGVALIDYFVLYKSMKWSLGTYYDYYASVVLGNLLDKSAQALSPVQSSTDRSGKREKHVEQKR
jgi:hypothetical protein